MANSSSQPAQGAGAKIQEPTNVQLRQGEKVLLVTRWDGGWANSIGVFALLGVLAIVGLLSGKGIWVFAGLVLGAATIIKLTLEILSRMNGRAVLTNQRIVVRGLPSPFVNSEFELTDVQALNAGTDLLRVGGGMSSMTVTTSSGRKRGIVLPHASDIVAAYNARFRA